MQLRCMCHKCPFSFFWTAFYCEQGIWVIRLLHMPTAQCAELAFPVYNIYLVLLLVYYHMLCCMAFSLFFLAWPEDRRQLNRHMQCPILLNCKALWLLGTFIFIHKLFHVVTVWWHHHNCGKCVLGSGPDVPFWVWSSHAKLSANSITIAQKYYRAVHIS